MKVTIFESHFYYLTKLEQIIMYSISNFQMTSNFNKNLKIVMTKILFLL